MADLMDKANLTVDELAEKSGLSLGTVRRAVRGSSEARLNTTSATAIAEALNVDVGDINWPGGLANSGRPARSGGHNTRHSG